MGKEERKLTPKEQKRVEKVEAITSRLIEDGYTQTDLTTDIVKANVYAVLLSIPFIAIFLLLLIYVDHFDLFSFGLNTIRIGILLISFFVLTVVHELIHGLFWSIFAKDHIKSIEFGFIAEMLTPYCTCLDPLKKWQYIVGSLAPGFILGIIPSILAVITGEVLFFYIGAVMIMGAGGDMTITIMLLKDKKASSTIYLDHPTKVGLMVFKK